MARIRSIHPDLFTDERFAPLSDTAKVVLFGLWCESDDQGVFRWNVNKLKLRLIPGSNKDLAPYLAELSAKRWIKPYKVDGRWYGACRNFQKYQHPRRPISKHPLLPNLVQYVTNDDTDDDELATDFEEAANKALILDDSGAEFPQMSVLDAVMEKEKEREVCVNELNKGETEITDISVEISEFPTMTGVAQSELPNLPDPVEQAVEMWNEMAKRHGLSVVQRITQQRRNKIRARLKEAGGLPGWQIALTIIEMTPYLLGDNDDGWRLPIDTLIRPDRFAKLMEGGYGRKPINDRRNADRQDASADTRRELGEIWNNGDNDRG